MTENEIQIAALKELVMARFEANNHALQIQSREYERRLEILNGEAARLREIQATYLPREVYESQHKTLCDDISLLKSFKDNLTGRMVIIPVIVSVVISLVFLLINYFVAGAK